MPPAPQLAGITLIAFAVTPSLGPSAPLQQLADAANSARAAVGTAESYLGLPGTADSLKIVSLEFGPARLGENPFKAVIHNPGDSAVTALLDLRAVPGMWMLPNNQARFHLELGPGEQGKIEGAYRFQRLSPEATLRVIIGPGSLSESGYYSFDRVDLRATYEVGRGSPDAYDPTIFFNVSRRGPLEIFTWRGSLADQQVETIAAERLRALEAIARLLAVDPPEHVRLVFYADEATKIEQTGHQGVGWARGTTLVEVYNEDIQIDPFHELVHIVAIQAGSPPAAVREGLAVYVSELLGADALKFLGLPGTKLDRVACTVMADPKYLPLRDLFALDNVGNSAERAPYEYAQAGAFVRYLIDHEGMDRFRALYSGTSEDAELQDNLRVVREVYGRSLMQLEREWRSLVDKGCA